jgi:chemotaxis protein histidine kinase CheA
MAAAALTDGARTPSALLAEARAGAARFHDAMARAAGELPALLESVRAGEPATDAARRVMDGFASAEALVAGLEDGLAAAVRQLAEGASACASSVREVRDAAARARLVPVGATLRSLSRKVAARASLEVAGADVEIDSALVDPVRQVLLDAVERRLPASRRRAALVRLAVSARHQDDWVVIRLTGGRVRERGETPAPVRHAAAQIARAGGAVRSGTVAEVRVPVWPGRVRCLLLRAGGHWYGIPAASVVECLNLRRGGSPSWGGKPVPVLLLESLFSPTAPGQEAGLAELAGVIVRSGRRRACLLGEAHGGVRTVALGNPARTGQGVNPVISPSSATADDGSLVTVLDPARLVRRALAPQEGGVRS